ncbi:MAG: HlyD family efflux transporter periplasmic adaptor subunit [Magnetococcus sp. DMHC-8]
MPAQATPETLHPTVAALLNLQQRVHAATTPAALGYVAVNETLFLVPYRQAALWQTHASAASGGRIVAVSGLPVVDPDAPYIQWLTAVLHHLDTRQPAVAMVDAAGLPDHLGRHWREWLPSHALWLPLRLPALDGEGENSQRVGGLLLVREHSWSEGEQHLLVHLGQGMAQVWWGLLARRPWWRRLWVQRPATRTLFWLSVVGGLLAWPVQQSVLAPAEVVAWQPAVVRAPLDGVVDAFLVTPNQSVQTGQPLLKLDTTRLRNRLEVTGKEWEVAQAEYRQAVQSALQDSRSKAKLALLLGRMQQKEADLAYVRSQLERVTLLAPRDGVAVFSDENDWVGRPVSVGERLLMLADPRQVELEIRLPVADALPAVMQDSGAAVRVELFPATDASHSLSARLRHASYRADLTPEGVLAYTLRARFDEGEPLPRLGLRGTAKLYGEPVRLFHYLFRRPLAAARQVLGW